MTKYYWEHQVIGPFSTNCYIFGEIDNLILFDPGGPEAVNIAKYLLEKELQVKHVLVSHGHFDHLGWAWEVQKVTEGAKVYLHEDEKETFEFFFEWMPKFGFEKTELREPDIWLKTNSRINIGGHKFEVLHTPGHSPGSATFVEISDHKIYPSDSEFHEKFSLVGDTIFQGSIGRADWPFSNPNDMINSLKLLMTRIPKNHDILPGHGPKTSMEKELFNNPYLIAIQKGIPIF